MADIFDGYRLAGERAMSMSVGWRLRIEHTTSVAHAGPVLTSFNEARMTPLTLPTQVTLESRVTAEPGVPVWTYNDYWARTSPSSA